MGNDAVELAHAVTLVAGVKPVGIFAVRTPLQSIITYSSLLLHMAWHRLRSLNQLNLGSIRSRQTRSSVLLW